MSVKDSILDKIVKAGDAKKASKIIVYQLTDTSFTDYMVIMGVLNPIHCKAVLEEINKLAKQMLSKKENRDFYSFPRVTGTPESGWVIVDLNSIIVHIVLEDIRKYYDLDALFENRAIVFYH